MKLHHKVKSMDSSTSILDILFSSSGRSHLMTQLFILFLVPFLYNYDIHRGIPASTQQMGLHFFSAQWKDKRQQTQFGTQ